MVGALELVQEPEEARKVAVLPYQEGRAALEDVHSRVQGRRGKVRVQAEIAQPREVLERLTVAKVVDHALRYNHDRHVCPEHRPGLLDKCKDKCVNTRLGPEVEP